MTYTQPVIISDLGMFQPYLRTNAEETIESRNVIHPLLGGGVSVTFGAAAKATSTLELLFTSEFDSQIGYTVLNEGHIFELVDYSKTSTSTYFVVAGAINRQYLTNTEDTWLITVDIQTVDP